MPRPDANSRPDVAGWACKALLSPRIGLKKGLQICAAIALIETVYGHPGEIYAGPATRTSGKNGN
jgi:hypothetical protein